MLIYLFIGFVTFVASFYLLWNRHLEIRNVNYFLYNETEELIVKCIQSVILAALWPITIPLLGTVCTIKYLLRHKE